MHDRGVMMASDSPFARDGNGRGQAQNAFGALITCRRRGQVGPGIDTPAERQQITTSDEAPDAGARDTRVAQLGSGRNTS